MMASSYLFPVSDGITPVAALGLVLTALFIPGRLTSNLRMQGSLYLDDFFAAAGFVLFISFVSLCFSIDAYARYYQHPGTWDPAAPYFLKTIFTAEILVPAASLTAKASVLLLYLRIFNPSIKFRRCVVTTLGITGMLVLPSFPVFSYYCAPNATTTMWAPSIAHTCASASIWATIQQIGDVLVNFAIFLLPLPSIFRLHLSLQRRLLLSFVLMHGVFALAASIVGAVYRVQLAKTSSDNLSAALWFRSASFTAFGVELSMTLVTGSMHACWGYLRSVHARHRSTKGSSGCAYHYDSEAYGVPSGTDNKTIFSRDGRSSATSPGRGFKLHLSDCGVFLPPQTSPMTLECSRRWAVTHLCSKSHAVPMENAYFGCPRPATAPTTTAVSRTEEEAGLRYPLSPSASEPSSFSRPSSPPERGAVRLLGAGYGTHTTKSNDGPRPSTHPLSHNRDDRLPDNDIGSSVTGKGRSPDGRRRPISSVSLDAADMRQAIDVPLEGTTTFYVGECGSTGPYSMRSETVACPSKEAELHTNSMEERQK